MATAARTTPIKRIHARLEELVDAPDASTEELLDALIEAYTDLIGLRPAEGNPLDYHRLPTWTGGVVGWQVPDGTTRTHTGSATGSAALPAPTRIRPARRG